jgi:amino-acid N-acetyltransferase
MISEDPKKNLYDEYSELAKNSLVRVQYSCGGNSSGIDVPEYIPIVPESFVPESKISYSIAREEDVVTIIELLKSNNLPTSDLSNGQRVFIIALKDCKTIGCVAVEVYGDSGLLRSLAVSNDFRAKGIGMKLVAEAEAWSYNNGLKCLYLLTTTASGFFPKMGWVITDRSTVPEKVTVASEFASVCPTTAVCMYKSLN